MLQLNHVTKIYSSEKGVDVRALDDINLSFDQTGMVFLLGKSGSGKSTLLNLCGGPDKPTSGKSSSTAEAAALFPTATLTVTVTPT